MAFPWLEGHSGVGLTKTSVSHGVREAPSLMHNWKERGHRELFHKHSVGSLTGGRG